MGSEIKYYSRAEVKEHSTTESCWTIIHNKVYDITNWIPKHPGGDLVRQGAGIECTAIFESSHPPHVNETFLAKFLIGELKKEERDTKFTYDSEFWTVLKKRVWTHFQKNKIRRHDQWDYYLKLICLFSLFLVTYYFGCVGGKYAWTLAASVIGPLCAICIMHDGQHGAASKYPFLNSLCGWVIDFFGASGYIWKHEHNLGHHQNTNTVEDPDAISGDPIVRLSPLASYKWYHKYQHYYVWLTYAFIMSRWYFVDYGHYFTSTFNGNKTYPASKTEIILFWLGKIVYPIYTFIIPAYSFGLLYGILCYLTFAIVASYSFAFQFTVNHLTSNVYWPSKSSTETDWAKLQVMTSANYAVDSKIAAIFSGGLNFQIEHHLFPTICHTHYRTIVSPIVQQTCKEYNVPYNALPTYLDAITGHYYQLRSLGNPDLYPQ